MVVCSSTVVPATVNEVHKSVIDCPKNLSTISVEDGNPYYDSREDCHAIIHTESNTLLVGSASTVIPNTVAEIGNQAFWGNDDLTEITIPKSVKKIGKYSFLECSNLKTVSIFGPIALIDEDTFRGCTSLETLNFDTGIKKFHPAAFVTCTALKTINVPAKKGDYYRSRLPENLRDLVVEMPTAPKGKK